VILAYRKEKNMNQFTLRTLDLPTLHRHAIGFDRLFDELNRTFANSASNSGTGYPPYNVVRSDETHYRVEIAVAGFAENEIDVEVKDGMLSVKGEQLRDSDAADEYLHRGISARSFVRTFNLADNMQVLGATVKNGILTISLEMVIPDEQKLRKISITYAK
jgi:molecular chaperone IbpA